MSKILDQIRPKLIAIKEKWAQEGRLLSDHPDDQLRHDRLPPGQRQVENWPVLDLGIQPKIPLENWELIVDGLVENPLQWRWHDFCAQESIELCTDIHCVTSWSRFDNHWQGVSIKHLLALVQPKPQAQHVLFHSYDGYTTNLQLPVFDNDDVLLAHRWQGQPIPTIHGGPVRIVVPKVYFWKSAKWIQRITFSADDHPGFWEVRGYHNQGNPWREERYR